MKTELRRTFDELLCKVRKVDEMPPLKLLALDPGHTCGYSVFIGSRMDSCGQVEFVVDRKGANEGKIDWQAIVDLFDATDPKLVVFEDYRVYQHKLERHSFSPVLTLRIIGGIELLCHQRNIPVYSQMAATAKGFVTDDKLKAWGFYKQAQRHSRDSIRHAIYFLLFSKLDDWRKYYEGS